MIKNNIIRRLALLISLIMLLTSTINTTFGFIVTKTDSLINTFVPFDSIISRLLISKNVEHPFGNEYVIPDSISFDFKVNFGSLYAKTTIKTTSGDIVADENGSIQISVKPGKTFAVDGIDAGTKVTVTEIQKGGSGFTVKDGAATMEGVVAEDGSLKFQYVNLYTPTSVSPKNVSVSGKKILEGRDWRDGDTFSFTLEQKQSNDTWASLGTKTITYNPDNKTFNYFDFSDIIQTLNFDKIGIYNFRLKEVIGNLENVDYDKCVNTFSIRVTDIDMDGKLEINTVTAEQNAKVEKNDDSYSITVTFNNTFVPVASTHDDISVKIKVNKTVKNTGEEKIGPEGFEFVLEKTENKEKLSRISGEDGKTTFTLPFTASDIGKTYEYKLFESNKGAVGVTYDTKVYNLSISVASDKNNKLIAMVIMDGQINENPIAEFVNTYHAQSPYTPQTSDNSNIIFWLIMMIVSGCSCMVLIIMEKRLLKTTR